MHAFTQGSKKILLQRKRVVLCLTEIFQVQGHFESNENNPKKFNLFPVVAKLKLIMIHTEAFQIYLQSHLKLHDINY